MPVHRGRRARSLTLALCVLTVTASAAIAITRIERPALATTSSYDPNGVLRYAYDLSGAGAPVFDPVQASVPDSANALGQLLYDSLLHKQPNGNLVPALATSATITDPQTIKVVVRPGVQFQDGTKVDANAVRFTLLRNRDSKNPSFGTLMPDVTAVDVFDPQTLTISLSKPEAGAFYPLLADLATMPVSPAAVQRNDADPITNPLGAGPFRVKEFVPEQRLALTKNKTYWNAKNIKLGGVEYVQAPTGPPAINALRAGTVDAIGSDLSQLQSLTGGNIQTVLGNAGTSLLWFPLCKTHKPLDDVRVRQALNYALDRNAINQALAQGKGQPAWSAVPPDNGLYNKKLDNVYAYNVKKAKALLKQAGHPDGVSLTVIPSPGISGQLTEIAQQYWAKAGIKVQITPSTNIVQDLFKDNKADMGAANVNRNGLAALQGIYTPGQLGDLCNYQDPKLTGMLNQLATLPSSDPQGKKIWADAQQFVSDNALSVYGVWLPAVVGYDASRVGGIKVSFPSVSPYPDFFSAYVKKS